VAGGEEKGDNIIDVFGGGEREDGNFWQICFGCGEG